MLQSYSSSAPLMSAEANKLCTTWPDSREKCVRNGRKVVQRDPGMLSGGGSRMMAELPCCASIRTSRALGTTSVRMWL